MAPTFFASLNDFFKSITIGPGVPFNWLTKQRQKDYNGHLPKKGATFF